jgi:hypothetical protein
MFTLLNKILIIQNVYAQHPDNLSNASDLSEIVNAARRGFNILVFIAGAVFIGYLIMGAYKFATAQGDPKGIAGAKQTLTHALIGLSIVIGVFALNTIIYNLLSPGEDDFGTVGGIFDRLEGAINNFEDWLRDY